MNIDVQSGDLYPLIGTGSYFPRFRMQFAIKIFYCWKFLLELQKERRAMKTFKTQKLRKVLLREINRSRFILPMHKSLKLEVCHIFCLAWRDFPGWDPRDIERWTALFQRFDAFQRCLALIQRTRKLPVLISGLWNLTFCVTSDILWISAVQSWKIQHWSVLICGEQRCFRENQLRY